MTPRAAPGAAVGKIGMDHTDVVHGPFGKLVDTDDPFLVEESHHFIDVRLLALPKVEVHPLADKVGRVGRNLAEYGIPQHPLGKPY